MFGGGGRELSCCYFHPSIEHVSLGALGDSFYEYLLKSWLMTSKDDVEARDMYFAAIGSIEKKLMRSNSDGSILITDYRNGRPDNKMQHLVCNHIIAMFQSWCG